MQVLCESGSDPGMCQRRSLSHLVWAGGPAPWHLLEIDFGQRPVTRELLIRRVNWPRSPRRVMQRPRSTRSPAPPGSPGTDRLALAGALGPAIIVPLVTAVAIAVAASMASCSAASWRSLVIPLAAFRGPALLSRRRPRRIRRWHVEEPDSARRTTSDDRRCAPLPRSHADPDVGERRQQVRWRPFMAALS